MQETYWFTFRLNEDAGYQQRYTKLREKLLTLSGNKWWVEPSAFVVFRSKLTIDAVAKEISSAMDTRIDLGLLGMADFKSARVIGAANDDDIYEFMPFARKA
jgi:hypothetical protein